MQDFSWPNMLSMERILGALRAPGRRRAVGCAASTQMAVNAGQDDDKSMAVNISTENINSYTVIAKARLLDRWLDKVVEV